MKNRSRLCFAVCSHFAQEAENACPEVPGVDVSIATFEAACEKPFGSFQEINEALAGASKEADHVILLCSSCCLTKAMQEAPPDWLSLVLFPQCFYLVAPKALVDNLISKGNYLLTPGWLAMWRSHLQKWGFDKASARTFFHESANSLLLLDTGIRDQSQQHLGEFADFLDLPSSTLEVGLQTFAQTMSEYTWRFAALNRLERLQKYEARNSELILAVDVMGEVASVSARGEQSQRIIELFSTVAAPKEVSYVLIEGSKKWKLHQMRGTPLDVQRLLRDIQPDMEYLRINHDGFALALREEGFLRGLLVVEEVAFPEYLEHYLNLALSVSPVLTLGLANHRTMDDLTHTIAALEKTQRDLKSTMDALRRSNEDLEAFASIAAHDLRAPSRRIGSFIAILEQDMPTLSGENRELFDLVRSQAAAMTNLVQSLLRFSRAGRAKLQLGAVSMSEVVGTVIELLEPQIQEQKAQIRVSKNLPTIRGDRVLLGQVFQNLLENGMKFCEGVPPRISISATRESGSWRFSLKDNGIGIEAEYLDKIFQPFQRLHSESRFPGSGIGLATTIRIVERHGGKLWAELVVGKGSTFHFRLPFLKQA